MLAEFARTLRRRWLSVALCVLLALAAGAGAFIAIGPTQQSSAQILFVPPRIQPGVNGETNPFLSLGGSLAIVASVVQVGVSDQDTQEDLYSKGDRAKYVVEPNLQENAGPVLLLTATDKSADVSRRTLAAVIDTIQNELRTIQSERAEPSNQYITAVTITQTPKPLPVRKAQIQKGVLGFVGVLLVMLGAVLYRERRRKPAAPKQKRGERPGERPGTGPAPTVEAEPAESGRWRRRSAPNPVSRHRVATPDPEQVGVPS